MDSQQPIFWAHDKATYSLTGLSIILEQHGLKWFKPKTFALWRIAGHSRSMWDEAEELRRGEEIEDPSAGRWEGGSEEKPKVKGTKKERTMHVLVRHCIVREGTEIELIPEAVPYDGAQRDPNLFRARIGNLGSPRSVIWKYDQKPYSLSKLSIILEQYGLKWFKPKTFELWRIVDETESMWDQAERLRRITPSHCEEIDLSPEEEDALERSWEDLRRREAEEQNQNRTPPPSDAQ
jgi:hypothetical protein